MLFILSIFQFVLFEEMLYNPYLISLHFFLNLTFIIPFFSSFLRPILLLVLATLLPALISTLPLKLEIALDKNPLDH